MNLDTLISTSSHHFSDVFWLDQWYNGVGNVELPQPVNEPLNSLALIVVLNIPGSSSNNSSGSSISTGMVIRGFELLEASSWYWWTLIP